MRLSTLLFRLFLILVFIAAFILTMNAIPAATVTHVTPTQQPVPNPGISPEITT